MYLPLKLSWAKLSKGLAPLLVGTILLGACGGGATTPQPSQQQSAKPLTDLKFQNCIAVLQVAIAPLLIGEPLGFLKEEGIGRVIVNLSPGATAQCVQLTASGSADLTSPIPEGPLGAAAKGQDPGVTYAFNAIRHPTAVNVVDPKSKFKTYKDLEGQKIGVFAAGNAYIPFFEAAMKANGADPKKVEYVVTGFGAQAADAVFTGKVAAGVSYDYEIGTWRAMGYNPTVLPLPADAAGLFSSGFAFNRDFLKNRRDLAVGFLRAFVKSVIFAQENPDATVRLFWQLVPESKRKDLSDADALAFDKTVMLSRLVNYSIGQNDPDKRWGAWGSAQWTAYAKFLGYDNVDTTKLYTMDLIPDVNKGIDEQAIRTFAKSYKVP